MSQDESLQFTDLNLPSSILKALDKIGYETPSPIQAKTIPILLEGQDVVGMAQTGTGKTAAFALPALAQIDVKQNSPQTLVMCPTRELAIQVAEAFQAYATELKGFHVLPLYGGQEMRGQLRSLKRGAHIVVGTPGRLLDHLRRKSLNLDSLKTLILDEADEMLRMGFIDDVEAVMEATPDTRQIALFSATMPAPIRRVANKYLNDPQEVKIETKVTTNENIEQCYWQVSGTNKLDALTRILEVEDFDGMIIFVRTKTATAELAEKLNARGFSAAALNGDMNQQLRVRTVEQLKSGNLDIVVATDVAARGIDVERITHVINFDIPYDEEAYVHRIGRTGRAGRKGKAILFVSHRERRLLNSIEKTTRQKIPRIELPTRKDLIEKRSTELKNRVIEALSLEPSALYQNIINDVQEGSEASIEQIAQALVHVCQENRPLEPPKEEFKKSTKEPRERNNDREAGRGRNQKRNVKEREKPKGKRLPPSEMEQFKIHVGHDDQVSPREIVGAIANEADISSQYIGKIDIRDSHSLVFLPKGMPNEVFEILKKTRVKKKALNIEAAKSGN